MYTPADDILNQPNVDPMDGDEAGKLFVGGLNWLTTEEGLKAYFERFGKVKDCVVMRDSEGRSRCFGFIRFEDPSVLDVVLEKTHILDKKQIDPKRASKRSLHADASVRDVSPSTSWRS